MHLGDPVGEVRGEDSEPGPDLEHHILGVELGEAPDDPENVVVDQEVLPEGLVRSGRQRHGNEKATEALASICADSSSGSLPRAAASTSTV